MITNMRNVLPTASSFRETQSRGVKIPVVEMLRFFQDWSTGYLHARFHKRTTYFCIFKQIGASQAFPRNSLYWLLQRESSMSCWEESIAALESFPMNPASGWNSRYLSRNVKLTDLPLVVKNEIKQVLATDWQLASLAHILWNIFIIIRAMSVLPF